MSQFNAIGEFGLNELLIKRLTTPGSANAPSVAPEVFPVLTLESDRPEWGFLKGELAAGCRVLRANLAGNFTMAQLYLPSTARTIAVVSLIQNYAASSLRIAQGVGISAGLGGWVANNPGPTPRDFRWVPQRCQLIVETNQNAAQPTTHGNFARLFNVTAEYTTPIIITPGTSLVLFTDAVDLAIDCNVAWTERGAQPGELV